MKVFWRCDAGCGGSGEISLGTSGNLWTLMSDVTDAHEAHSKDCEDRNMWEHIVAEIEEDEPGEGLSLRDAAVELGRKGGRKGAAARNKNLSPERRSEISRLAALKRWERPR